MSTKEGPVFTFSLPGGRSPFSPVSYATALQVPLHLVPRRSSVCVLSSHRLGNPQRWAIGL